MGIRLRILAWWTPKYILRRELTKVSNQTTNALKSITKENSALDSAGFTEQTFKSLKVQRAAMAKTHARLVEKLEFELGHEKAIALGREALFSVGENLGKQTRVRLGVGDSAKDLTRAAKILYRVLGIEFQMEWVDKSNAHAIITRCALSEQYSTLACEVLSATDEGVINGLQPNVTMKFKEYMTSGCKNCHADIHLNGKEVA